MTAEQQKWLNEHPKHEVYRQPPVVTTWNWTDDRYLLPDGGELPEKPTFYYWPGMRLMSAGDTLYTHQDVLRVGRKYDIC